MWWKKKLNEIEKESNKLSQYENTPELLGKLWEMNERYERKLKALEKAQYLFNPYNSDSLPSLDDDTSIDLNIMCRVLTRIVNEFWNKAQYLLLDDDINAALAGGDFDGWWYPVSAITRGIAERAFDEEPERIKCVYNRLRYTHL